MVGTNRTATAVVDGIAASRQAAGIGLRVYARAVDGGAVRTTGVSVVLFDFFGTLAMYRRRCISGWRSPRGRGVRRWCGGGRGAAARDRLRLAGARSHGRLGVDRR